VSAYIPNDFLCWQSWSKNNGRGDAIKTIAQRLVRFMAWDLQALLKEAVEQRFPNSEAQKLKQANSDKGEDELAKAGVTPRFDQLMKQGRKGYAIRELARNGGGMRHTRSEFTDEVIAEKVKDCRLPGWTRGSS
jgi:hypothetical protein